MNMENLNLKLDYKEKFSEDAKTFEEAFTELTKFVDSYTLLPTA